MKIHLVFINSSMSNMIRMGTLWIMCLIYGLAGICQTRKTYNVQSPDKSTSFEIRTDSYGQLQYRMSYNGRKIIDWSELGIVTASRKKQDKNFITGIKKVAHKETFAWLFGECDSIKNNYNELIVQCTRQELHYGIVVRAFNRSVAFRYLLQKAIESPFRFINEATTFQLAGNYTLFQYNQESVFTPTDIDTLNKNCDLPATLTNGELYISIGEADNNQFTKAELKRGKENSSLIIEYVRDSTVVITGKWLTPWRSISVSKTAIGLHDFSDLGLRLSPASNRPVSPAIKPGKLIRAQLNTQSGLDCIDFAARHHFQYIMYDAGWYGAEFYSSSDPTQVIPAIDMPRVITYGKEKGIGVILYVNYVGLKEKLDTILPLYKNWGVAGLKFGFVDGLTQNGIIWLNNAIQKVNEYGFVLNIHDNYKPTGLSRTYPALLTQEGVRGDENSPDAFHNTVLPFTRFLAGAADFTYCFPNSRNSFSKNIKVSKVQQLSLAVVYYSPLQAIFWYGQPIDYTNEEEIEFFSCLPTVWNESYYLAGGIGKNIAVARRHGDTWYIGCVSGFESWVTELKMGFLPPSITYEATIYEDDDSGGIHKRTEVVHKGNMFPVNIRAKAGQAIILREKTSLRNTDKKQNN
ncbi:glycoside hydrolase family 97 protein [Chitinophaga tropicalis]|uniref:Alpha-glucosidase n=1 Tax=Chitinophaga tropicalis TaxID=2683588 RepID=A0A7K1U7N0_9BACT|nr:glycoside hydrolase family 97 protein [Chitinophaga tropicalis]MVT10351.1 hypothetical protein [Chitinophaga tropicalis]